MDFSLTSTLQQVALVKIAGLLWDSHGVREFASPNCSKVFTHLNMRKFRKIANAIKKGVFELPLPVQLQKKLSSFICPMGGQILAWLNVHNSRFDTESVTFYWTIHGTIDDKKTAEMLIQNECIQDDAAYCEISNLYCLENEYTLWTEYNNRDTNNMGMSTASFISTMMSYLEKESVKLDEGIKLFCKDLAVSPFERAFRFSALSGNEAATKYLLRYLSPPNKERTLVLTAVYLIRQHCDPNQEFTAFYCRSYFTNVLCFILSNITEEQQMKVFDHEPFNVLICLLDWPWQCFLPKVLEHVIVVLSCAQLSDLLLKIHDKLQAGFDDDDYEYVFEAVWRQCPEVYKDTLLYGKTLYGIMHDFLLSKRKKICILMVMDFIAIRGTEFILQKLGIFICGHLIDSNMWPFFKFFVQTCILSEESLIEFKEKLKASILNSNRSAEIMKKRENLWKKGFEKITEYVRFKRKIIECDEPSKHLSSLLKKMKLG